MDELRNALKEKTDRSVDRMVRATDSPFEGKSGFVSHTKHTAEATNMDLFHS